MFDDILRIFDFLSLKQTESTQPVRKPMAIPLDPRLNALNLCKTILTKLDAAEADVLQNIDDPKRAWTLLSNVRQLRRETFEDLQSLLPDGFRFDEPKVDLAKPVRTVMTKNGATLAVFNGGQTH
ncbi:hypothetical protein U737_15315 [Methylomonas sp. LW13]|uniref:Uncharacterized protein n=1 Tax=Methylomonas rapida TaxID=2963939 RepID=A0ABY7GEE4_9GAMM|nr:MULTISPECIES: hypothetical protein [Methylomonas]QBC28157.1 hypothetical protein U737_15315 [Methylomonas sp. LW13]WAR43644.1 hypothetical protein NM686_014830 [Methylomonas rapida]